MIFFRIFTVTWVIAFGFLTAHAADPVEPLFEPEMDSRHNWWGDIDEFLNAQARRSLHLADIASQQTAPSPQDSLERRMMFSLIDGVLHEELAPRRAAVQEFLNMRIARAADEMEQTEVQQGAMIWKLYNQNFIVRTKSVTIAFDLVRGRLRRHAGFGIENDLAQRIIDQCDVLFLSHRHGDHADQWVVERFLDAGKPVVAPVQVWRTQEIHGRITHLKREPHVVHELMIQEGQRALQVVIYPGHQGADVDNNVTLVFTPEGMSFAHTGDQSFSPDFPWIDRVGEHYQVDVLMPNCWAPSMARMVQGFAPNLVLPGHENEMGHSIDHREPYWLNHMRFKEVPAPWINMAWGERYHYIPEAESS